MLYLPLYDLADSVRFRYSLCEANLQTLGNKVPFISRFAVGVVNLRTATLEYSPAYAESLATNECFYVDTSRSAEERSEQAATYNKGFAYRKARLGTSSRVSTEIPLNRYSFFESLEDELLPNTPVELNFETERDGNVIWQAGADCRVIITRMQLIIPRITFNSGGQELYMSAYLKPHKWTYLRENIESSAATKNDLETSESLVGFLNLGMFLSSSLTLELLTYKQRIPSSTTRLRSQQIHVP